jgi:hypothetical protein
VQGPGVAPSTKKKKKKKERKKRIISDEPNYLIAF